MPRKYTFNEEIFDIIDNEEKAYWLGFLAADGYVDKQLSKFGIELSIKDHDYSKEFEWCGWNLKYLNKVYNQSRKEKKFPKKHYKATEYILKFSWNQQEGLVFSMENTLNC